MRYILACIVLIAAGCFKSAPAADESKETLLYFSMRGCAGCVHKLPEAKAIAKEEGFNFVLTKREDDLALHERWKVSLYPTIILLSPDGVQQWRGHHPSDLREWLKKRE